MRGLAAVAASMLVAALLSTMAEAGHGTLGANFEIDAGTLEGWAAGSKPSTPGTVGTPTAFWSNTANHRDWVDGGPGGGYFELSGAAPHTAASDCYGSNIDFAADTGGAVLDFICDGHSDSKFSGKGGSLANEKEQNVITPSGKTLDDVWPVKPGNNTAKDDFTHAYNAFVFADSVCDADTDADDLFMIAGANRGDNEGTQFWGAELNQTPPAGFDDLLASAGADFSLDFNRTAGDLLAIFDNSSGGNVIDIKIATWDGSTYAEQAATGCTQAPGTNGNSAAQTNGDSDSNTNNAVEAPPWSVPVCDPTVGDGSALGNGNTSNNSCRLAAGSATPTSNGNHLIAERDFFEAVVDLSAYNIPPTCFTSLVFTSRSSDTVNADLKDVAGGKVGLCSLKVQKFIDKDQDGVLDSGEPTSGTDVTGWTFDVYADIGTDPGVVDAGDTLVCDNITSGANGLASCDNAVAGSYLVVEVNTGTTITVNNVGSIITTPNPQQAVVGQGATVVNVGNTCRIKKTFTVTGLPTNGVSSVSVAWTFTGQGLTDAHGASTAGSPLTLTDAGNGTSNDGIWSATTAHVFDVGDKLSWSYTVNGTITNAGGSHEFTLAEGYPACAASENTVQASPNTINGFKYKDIDADGIVDAGEAVAANALSGWTFTLTKSGDANFSMTDTTDANGFFEFTGLGPGTYTVTETEQGDWQSTNGTARSGLTVTLGNTISIDDTGANDPQNNPLRAFLNAPEARFDVRFFDLTDSTDASIDCIKQGGTEVESSDTTTQANSGGTNPETVVVSDDLLAGTYQCTLVITDP